MQGSIGTMLQQQMYSVIMTFLYCPVKSSHANLLKAHKHIHAENLQTQSATKF